MTDPLYIAEIAGVKVGEKFTLTGSEGRHAATVKRAQPGERVYLADGKGRAVHGPITEVAKHEITIAVEEVLTEQPRELRWVAVQALAKGERSEIAIEALTELGVDEIIAWQASRSIVLWQNKTEKGLAKWCSTVTEASKQSRRFTVPKVSYADTKQVCRRLENAALAIVLHEQATRPLKNFQLPGSGEIIFVVGPEGGISEAEIAQFEAHGARTATLGPQILRTSTAGLVALSGLQVLAR